MTAGLLSEPEVGFTVLLVCTGNICRSALGERWARARVAGAPRPEEIRVVSAGTRAVTGSAMHPDSARALGRLGGDPEGFRARQLTTADVMAADLVLAMTRDHRREVLGTAPRALARTFTLREAADLADLVGPDLRQAGDGVAAHGRALVRAMAAARSRHVSGPDDDIADPIDGPPSAHDAAGEAIARALGSLIDRFLAVLPTA